MNNQNFYTAIRWILILVIAAAALTWFNSCTSDIYEVYSLQSTVTKDSISVGGTNGVNTIALQLPIDPDHHEQEPIIIDTTVIDTVIPVDTLPIILDTPCIPELVTEPKFVTLYLEFDVFDPFILWQGGQVESNNLSDVVQAVTNLPFHIYTQGKSWVIIIDGTNDHQQFQLKIFARSNGAKIYFGSASQAYIFAGALAFTEYMEVIEKYPSVDRFNFRNTQWDSLQYDQAAKEILNCKLGRTWADFRFNQFPVSDSLITEYQNAGWETVLH